MTLNQNPEQKARDNIDKLLLQAGWVIQNKKQINLDAGIGQAVREYQTDTGPADYILFVARKPVGVIEAKEEKPRPQNHQR
jgi:type I restriction enzyme, R subunit